MFPMNNKMAMLGGMGSMMGNPYTAMNPWAAASRFGSAMGFPGMGGRPNMGMLMAMAQQMRQAQGAQPMMTGQQATDNALAAYRQPQAQYMPNPMPQLMGPDAASNWGQMPNAMPSMPGQSPAPMMMGPRPAMGMLGGMSDPASGMAQTAQAQRPFMNRFGGMGGM